MKTSSILIAEKKKVKKYNPSKDIIEWEFDFQYKVSGLSRIDNIVFVTTYSNWGLNFTNLLDFDSGTKILEVNEMFYSIHIIDNTLIFSDNKKFFRGIDIKTGKEIFAVKSPFKWSKYKVMMLNKKFYLFSSKKIFELNCKNGKIHESKLPNNFNLKEIKFVLDEFQININSLSQGYGDASFIFAGGTVGGADFVGDTGGGGGDSG